MPLFQSREAARRLVARLPALSLPGTADDDFCLPSGLTCSAAHREGIAVQQSQRLRWAPAAPAIRSCARVFSQTDDSGRPHGYTRQDRCSRNHPEPVRCKMICVRTNGFTIQSKDRTAPRSHPIPDHGLISCPAFRPLMAIVGHFRSRLRRLDICKGNLNIPVSIGCHLIFRNCRICDRRRRVRLGVSVPLPTGFSNFSRSVTSGSTTATSSGC